MPASAWLPANFTVPACVASERQAAVGHDVLALVHVAAALRAEALPVGVRPGDGEDVVHEPEALAARAPGAPACAARAPAPPAIAAATWKT